MTAPGGLRANQGRKLGTISNMSKRAREEAQSSGLLPHEWLLKVARGEAVEQKHWDIEYDKKGRESKRTLVSEEVYASFPDRIDAAKAAAPYYAPKLVAQQVSFGGNVDSMVAELRSLALRLPV